jgi:hypothetical protein
MRDICVDVEGQQRCWNCGGRNFTQQRTTRSKVAFGIGAALTKPKLRCVRCNEYNDVGNAKAYQGPYDRRYKSEWLEENTQAAKPNQEGESGGNDWWNDPAISAATVDGSPEFSPEEDERLSLKVHVLKIKIAIEDAERELPKLRHSKVFAGDLSRLVEILETLKERLQSAARNAVAKGDDEAARALLQSKLELHELRARLDAMVAQIDQ